MLRKLSIVMIIIGVMFCTVAGISIINDPKIEKLYLSDTEITMGIAPMGSITANSTIKALKKSRKLKASNIIV